LRAPVRLAKVPVSECEIILDKSAELELKEQNITDPETVKERVAAFKSARGDELLAKCKGRTVTGSALTCVKKAQSADELDRCLY
jgi:hypothetical protein